MTDQNGLYRDGKIYDALNDDLVADSDFYLNELKHIDGDILELACGTGRIACKLAEAGRKIAGLDLSTTMLSEARQKSQQLKLDIEWLHGDMTDFNLNKKFDVIFIGFNSVQHLLENSQLTGLLLCVKKHLKPGGRFLFDIFNPKFEYLMGPKVRRENRSYIELGTNDEVFVTEEAQYDSATQINHITYFYSKKAKPDFYFHPLNMRCYFPQEIDAHLRYNGFTIAKKYGSFGKQPFSGDSNKQIFDCIVA